MFSSNSYVSEYSVNINLTSDYVWRGTETLSSLTQQNSSKKNSSINDTQARLNAIVEAAKKALCALPCSLDTPKHQKNMQPAFFIYRNLLEIKRITPNGLSINELNKTLEETRNWPVDCFKSCGFCFRFIDFYKLSKKILDFAPQPKNAPCANILYSKHAKMLEKQMQRSLRHFEYVPRLLEETEENALKFKLYLDAIIQSRVVWHLLTGNDRNFIFTQSEKLIDLQNKIDEEICKVSGAYMSFALEMQINNSAEITKIFQSIKAIQYLTGDLHYLFKRYINASAKKNEALQEIHSLFGATSFPLTVCDPSHLNHSVLINNWHELDQFFYKNSKYTNRIIHKAEDYRSLRLQNSNTFAHLTDRIEQLKTPSSQSKSIHFIPILNLDHPYNWQGTETLQTITLQDFKRSDNKLSSDQSSEFSEMHERLRGIVRAAKLALCSLPCTSGLKEGQQWIEKAANLQKNLFQIKNILSVGLTSEASEELNLIQEELRIWPNNFFRNNHFSNHTILLFNSLHQQCDKFDVWIKNQKGFYPKRKILIKLLKDLKPLLGDATIELQHCNLMLQSFKQIPEFYNSLADEAIHEINITFQKVIAVQEMIHEHVVSLMASYKTYALQLHKNLFNGVSELYGTEALKYLIGDWQNKFEKYVDTSECQRAYRYPKVHAIFSSTQFPLSIDDPRNSAQKLIFENFDELLEFFKTYANHIHKIAEVMTCYNLMLSDHQSEIDSLKTDSAINFLEF